MDEGFRLSIGSKFKSLIDGINVPQQYEEGHITLTLYPGVSSCWIGDVGGQPDKPVVARQRYGQDSQGIEHTVSKLIRQRKSVRLRLIVHRPEIFYKLVYLKDRFAAVEYLKGMFPYLTPPMALNSHPLEGTFGENKYNVLSAVELTPFRRIVEELGEGVLNLEAVVPLPIAAILAIDRGLLDLTAANLVFPGHHCTSMIIGAKDGPYLIRSFTPGWLSVVKKFEEAGLSRIEAVTALLDRPELSGSSAYEGILNPFRREVKAGMDETIKFYRDQLNEIPPDKNLLCGLEIPDILFSGEQADFNPVALVSQLPEDKLPNILKGTPEPLYKKGSFNYVYDPARSAFKEFKEPPKQLTPSSRKRGRKLGVDYKDARGKLFEIIDLIRKRLTSGTGKERETKILWDLKIALALPVVVFFFIANGYFDLVNQYEKLVSSFADVQSQISFIHKEIEKSAKIPKDFWTEKMMALAGEITPPLFITDFSVGAEDIKGKGAAARSEPDSSENKAAKNQQKAGTEIHSHRITIEGASMPPSFGHVREIANFMDRLRKNKVFMKNITEFTFKGLTLAEGDKGDMVRFSFEAIYLEGGSTRNK